MTVTTSSATISAPAYEEAPTAYRIYVLILLVTAYSISYVDRTLVGALAPLIKADLHLSDTQLGFIGGTAFAICFVAASIPFGWLADRYSRKWIIGGSLTFWSLCTALFGAGHSYVQLLAARSGVGVGEAGGGAPSHSMLMDYYPRSQRARAMAIYGCGVPVGIGLGAMFGGWGSAAFGWRATFFIAGAIGIVLALLMAFTLREPLRRPEGTLPEPLPLVPSVLAMLKTPAFVPLCLGASCGSVAGFAKYFWMPTFFVRSFELPLVHVTSIFGTIHLVAGIAGACAGGFVSDWLARRGPRAHTLVTAASYVICTPLFFFTLMAGSGTVAFVAYFFVTLLGSIGNGPIVAATQHLATPALRGTAAALLNTILITFAMALGVPFVGLVSDILMDRLGADSLRYALLVLPGFYLLGAGLLIYSASRVRPHPATLREAAA